MMDSRYIQVSERVKDALENKQPVVALESTIISHGFSYPNNVKCALACEEVIEKQGAVSATIAIIGGVVHVGLSEEQIEYMGATKGVAKASRRDVGVLCALKKDGATTVSATMMIANKVGIDVFATGGIGGVHRGAESTFDISADLTELGNTSICVVCAGAKSVLDIGLTLEYLETQGVPVIGYQSDDFPAFYIRKSGYGVDYRMEDAKEVAKILAARKSLQINGAMLVANPIPQEHEMDAEKINHAISSALQKAKEENIHGKAVTPYLLATIHTLTEGKSEDANLQLVLNNSKVAADIAVSLCNL